MKIFTSYYANVKGVEGYKVQISVSAPVDFSEDYTFDSIAPNKSTLWNHKNQVINDAQYTKEYLAKLNSHKEEILNKFFVLSFSDKTISGINKTKYSMIYIKEKKSTFH